MNLPLLLLILGVSQRENQPWEDFKLAYNKNYDTLLEEIYRRDIFLKNLQEIKVHNEKYEQGLETFEKAVNEFSDMEDVEFQENVLNFSSEELDPLLLLEQEAMEMELNRKWKEFKMTHGKKYESIEEEFLRKSIFDANVQTIENHNQRYAQGLETFYMGINQFTDLTDQEFLDMYASGEPSDDKIDEEQNFPEMNANQKLAKTINYYTKRIKVKSQSSHCGSCWAFATTGVLEYLQLLAYKKVMYLSEQCLVDCDSTNNGCNGGRSDKALLWVQQNGISFEKDYKYVHAKGQCKKTKTRFSGSFIKSVKHTRPNEVDMVQALGSYGPLKVSVNAQTWQHYKGGYMTAEHCGPKTGHAVVAVGAIKEVDKAKKEVDLWLIRNSWGAHWGIQGHIKLKMFENTCGIGGKNAFYITH